MAFNPQMAGKGAGNVLNSLLLGFNNPYTASQNQYNKYYNTASGYQMPFYNAGVNSLDPYQQRLQQMSDPQDYYNSIMSGYSSSPYSQYEQQQAMNSANNMASASGLTGSTPLMMQEQQTAEDISSKDMDKYFQNIMGINNDYMSGLNNLIGGGEQSANVLTQLASQMMRMMGLSSGMNQFAKAKTDASGLTGLTELGLSFL